MVEKVRPTKQNSFRATNEFADIARTVGEVDDYVLQEFLTDIIDGGVGGHGSGPALETSGGVSAGGVGSGPTALFGGFRQSSFGLNDFNAPVSMMGSPWPSMDIGTAAGVAEAGGLNQPQQHAASFAFAPPGVSSAAGAGAKDAESKKGTKKARSRRASRASNTGSEEGLDLDDQDMDADVRRKRQRQANLQAQRRCRERHRNHVTNLEAELDALRVTADAASAENARLQSALQRSLLGLEDCQRRWHSMKMDNTDMSQMQAMAEAKMGEMAQSLRLCAAQNTALVTALRVNESPRSSAGGAPPGSGSGGDTARRIEQGLDGMDIATGSVDTEHVKPESDTFGVLGGALAAASGFSAGGKKVDDDSLVSLQQQAAELEKRATHEPVSDEDMKRVALRLTKQFRTYLVDGNACSSAVAFASVDGPSSANHTPAGPGQTRSVLKRANEITRALNLSDTQRARVLQLWKTHSEKLYALFERRKKLTADALMLQGTSPVATLVDFLSIGSGTLSMVRNEEELMERGGQMTLTGFAQHACRLQGVISELRDNIGAEQMQNFVLVSEVVDDVFTPIQTCHICANWGPECPDMLAISRAITVQTMEENVLGAP
jgi:hypothetical protein